MNKFLHHQAISLVLNWVELWNQDTIVVYFSELVEVSEVVKTHLWILRYEEVLVLSADAHVDIRQSTIHVNEYYVVVEDKQIHN